MYLTFRCHFRGSVYIHILGESCQICSLPRCMYGCSYMRRGVHIADVNNGYRLSTVNCVIFKTSFALCSSNTNMNSYNVHH